MGYFIDWFVSYNAFKFALCGCLWAPADPKKSSLLTNIYFLLNYVLNRGNDLIKHVLSPRGNRQNGEVLFSLSGRPSVIQCVMFTFHIYLNK